MTDPRELLSRQQRIPSARAVALEAEVRTQSTLPFHTVSIPDWANPAPIGTMHEWRCNLTWPQVLELQQFLQTPLPPGPSTPEALIDAAMRALRIGFYVGTFIGSGWGGGSDVRMLFSYNVTLSVQDIGRAWAALVQQPEEPQKPAAEAITRLRGFWNAGTNSDENGLMMLVGVDLAKALADPEQFPFASIDRKPPPAR